MQINLKSSVLKIPPKGMHAVFNDMTELKWKLHSQYCLLLFPHQQFSAKWNHLPQNLVEVEDKLLIGCVIELLN